MTSVVSHEKSFIWSWASCCSLLPRLLVNPSNTQRHEYFCPVCSWHASVRSASALQARLFCPQLLAATCLELHWFLLTVSSMEHFYSGSAVLRGGVHCFSKEFLPNFFFMALYLDAGVLFLKRCCPGKRVWIQEKVRVHTFWRYYARQRRTKPLP